MKKLFSKLGMVGLLSFLLIGFSQVGMSNEVFDLSNGTMLLADNHAEVAPAVEAVEEAPTLDTGDTAWMIVATILVIVMAIPGLALFYGGLVRSKNMLSVLMQVFVTFSLMSVLWVVYGYSLAFTEGPYNTWIGGLGAAFLGGISGDSISGTIPEYVFVTFQLTFAALTPALIVGGFAERIKFSGMLVFLTLWLTVVYLPICHMVWGGGLLAHGGQLILLAVPWFILMLVLQHLFLQSVLVKDSVMAKKLWLHIICQ